MSDAASHYIKPADKARMGIDGMLTRGGWVVQDYMSPDLWRAKV